MEKQKKKKLGKKIGSFFVAGVTATVVDYAVYTLVARIIGNNDFLVLASIISGTLGIVVSYIMNSRITWKEKDPGKSGVVKFFGWNIFKTVAIRPVLVAGFGFLTAVYEFAFSISSSIGLPFDYEFVESTGIFCFATASTMVLSYLVYDKLIFSREKEKRGEKKDVESVRESREEEVGKSESKKDTKK